MPERVIHTLGEALTRALMSGDFALYRSILALPMRFTPKDGKPYVLEDEAALRADFDLYVSIIRLHGVTDIYRQVLGVDWVDDGQVWVRFQTHILVRARLLTEPFATRMRMQRAAQGPSLAEGWRIAEIESSEGHLNWSMGRADVSPVTGFQTRRNPNPQEE